jgi:endonuclease YncB( thermonuclease family)
MRGRFPRGFGSGRERASEASRGDQARARLRNLLLEGAASVSAGPADNAYFEALRDRVLGLSDAHRAVVNEGVAEHVRDPDDVVARDELFAKARRG